MAAKCWYWFTVYGFTGKKINLRLDYAWGVDGNQGIYFGVMEAF